jgi:CRP/FNR family transcriptional regulator, cyclic AMP receptor protein
MKTSAWAPVGLCRLLEEDDELANGVPEGARERATLECICRAITVRPGSWDGSPLREPGRGIGLLVLDGLLIRRVGVDARFGAELLGEGDLLRPNRAQEGEAGSLPVASGWRVLVPTRMALLDEPFAARLGRYPQLIGVLVDRALRRSRDLSLNMAIIHQARVEIRLHMLLWHLAARWGRVGPEGIVLPLHLTHEVLADLVAARRPTVTSALSALSKRGMVRSLERRWLLLGRPPGELYQLAPLTTTVTAEAASRGAAHARR